MEKNIDFTEGKIVAPLLKFAGPVLMALFLQAMYGAVDLLVVGKFAGSAETFRHLSFRTITMSFLLRRIILELMRSTVCLHVSCSALSAFLTEWDIQGL
ncbi:hypothetical protein [Butyrivibrio sp. LB2008]|uniref:hypothetical protein n=1 Tax=Butyrivibrio sp. LB2008 TaxID=1408305 RepID=UPI00047D6A9F|nr:hypothetical protein [Butyrivibrio sp. LB2008]